MAAQGVFTDAFREKYADLAADQLTSTQKTNLPLAWFRVGEGGFTLVGSSKVPKTPVSTKTTLEATVDMINDPSSTSSTGGYFTKLLVSGKVTVVGRVVTVVCELSSTEPDLDNQSRLTGNLGNPPQLFELGIYDGDPAGDEVTGPATLLAYCTFNEVLKVTGVATTITVTINY